MQRGLPMAFLVGIATKAGIDRGLLIPHPRSVLLLTRSDGSFPAIHLFILISGVTQVCSGKHPRLPNWQEIMF